jgi:hypothetical protein
MRNIKDIPSGADIPIQRYQKWFYDKLKIIWGLDDITYESYGKVNRNNTKTGYVPQWFVSSLSPNNTTYKDVFFDQSIHWLVSFFTIDLIRKYNNSGSLNAPVSIIFIGNAAKIKSTAWRGTEEVKQDLYNLTEAGKYGFTLINSETGYKNVFKDFDGWIADDTKTYMDLHPMFVLRLNFNLLYNIPINFMT